MPGASAFAGGLPPVRHAYPLAVRDAGLTTAIGLLLRTLPYAAMRFAMLLGFSIAAIVWLCIAVGGAAFLGTHVAAPFGWVWLILCLGGTAWLWYGVLRYLLHLVACGHVAVLTELILHGRLDLGGQSMFTHGRRVVTERIGQVTLLFGLNAAVRGILQAVHRTLDWISELLPVPGLQALATLATIILRAATRYLDKVIFSYNLARNDGAPWRGAREGIVYYCQNARPILKTAIWVVVLERGLTFLLWMLLLAPAAGITLALPSPVRSLGAIVTIIVAALLAGCLRSAFIKPLFMIMIMVRFHAAIEGQPIDPNWDNRLRELSSNFAGLGQGQP
jgi:hypothetical protein